MKPYRFFLLGLALCVSLPLVGQSDPVPSLEWEVGFHQQQGGTPQAWYPARVPGAVQLDYAKANGWPPYSYGENWQDYRWMEDVFWTYRSRFVQPRLREGERAYFVSQGIDYEFEVWLNGQRLLKQEGMFKAVELDLTDHLEAQNELKVVIYPVPKIPGKPDDRQQAAQSVKPAVSYLWDWHPRLIPSGIWDETYLEVRMASQLRDVYLDYQLTDDFAQADIRFQVQGIHIQDKAYAWKLLDANGKSVLQHKGSLKDLPETTLSFASPQLWWTHDHGQPYLYTSVFQLLDGNGRVLDEASQQLGFRRVRLVMHEGAWRSPQGFPKGRSNPPITVELNGRRIFGKGSNWVNPEIFPGLITRQRYDTLLSLAVDAHFNLLRIWGGGIVNKEAFYELCNEKGLLVWTEFPLACNNYLGTSSYLAVLEQEAEAIIRRIRKHPSNAIWSGGNELFNAWSGMTDQSLALRQLNSQCYQLDPRTPFIPTSPLMGMGHGHYVFKDPGTGEEVYDWMARATNTAYTEFGMPGAAPVELLTQIIPEDELFPPEPGGSWESHHAFNAWVGDTWLMKDLLKAYFGPPENLEALVAQSQWLQSEGYKCIFEEARRQKPVCAMALNWCYNEPWITAANNSLINYPYHPKPAFYAVGQSCRPFMASARLRKFSWKEGETFACDLYVLNDLYEEVPEAEVSAYLMAGDQRLDMLTWEAGTAAANAHIPGPTARAVLPYWDTDRFTLHVEVKGHPEYNSDYTLRYTPTTRPEKSDKAPTLNQ